MYKLRPYQQEAVDSTIEHFKKSKKPALITLPTGAGKSLVIANLAKKAKGRVLVMAHVKELVAQNHEKYISYGLEAGIFSAGLKKKDTDQKVIFGSIQSIQNAKEDFFGDFNLVIIDECHRVNTEYDSQYAKVINLLKSKNESICLLGLTATPYRTDIGWQYQYHHKGIIRTEEERFFERCIYELPLSYMIKNKYLTPFIQIDAPVACYDFSSLKVNSQTKDFTVKDIEKEISKQKRVTPGIIEHIKKMSDDRQGVMIFTASIPHAKEIISLLPADDCALVISDMKREDRDLTISRFKNREYKYLVNVSVLTTGFDAPHVDLIAILRPTQSTGLYQQIVGRGLRLSEGKEDCLILDYAGNQFNIYNPIIEEHNPNSDSVPVEVDCPKCSYTNSFWGIKDDMGFIIEHYGRKCKALIKDEQENENPCDFRFRFKSCPECFEENDITARSCQSCHHLLIDNDKKLKEAMQLKNAHIMKPDTMTFDVSMDKKGNPRLEIRYYDLDANHLSEYFYLEGENDWNQFYYKFSKIHNKTPEQKIYVKDLEQALRIQNRFKIPSFVIAHKEKYYWKIREKIFDY